jgi:hypothetical protein
MQCHVGEIFEEISLSRKSEGWGNPEQQSPGSPAEAAASVLCVFFDNFRQNSLAERTLLFATIIQLVEFSLKNFVRAEGDDTFNAPP